VEQLRPGQQPLTHLYSGIAHAIFAAFVSGRWSDAYALFPLLQERLLTQSEYGPLATHCEKGYYSLLQNSTGT